MLEYQINYPQLLQQVMAVNAYTTWHIKGKAQILLKLMILSLIAKELFISIKLTKAFKYSFLNTSIFLPRVK